MKVTFLPCLLCCLFLWKSSSQPTNILLGYQDSLGQYSFGYSTFSSARSEVKTVDGTIRGAYSYIDDNGMVQSIEYVADNDGFRVVATNLPQGPLPVEDTAEVIVARKDHLIAEQMVRDSEYEKEKSIDSKENVYENLEIIKVDKEGILTKDNQEVNSKEAGNVSSLIDNDKFTKINSLPVPAFKISLGNQILEPMEKTSSVNKDDQRKNKFEKLIEKKV